MRKIGTEFLRRDYSDGAFFSFLRLLGFEATFTPYSEDHKMISLNVAAAKKAGVPVEFQHSPFNGQHDGVPYNINDIWFDTPAGEQMTDLLFDSLKQCGENEIPVTVIHLSSGNNPPIMNDLGIQRYEALVSAAKKAGVKIAFENIRKLYNVAWAFDHFRDDDTVGFCWDCGHENCYTKSIEFMPLFGDRLLCTHIHDNDGAQDNDQHLLPFDGTLNFDRFAEHIRKSGFKGTLMLEIAGKNGKVYPDLPYEDYLRRAAAAAKRLRDMVDGQ